MFTAFNIEVVALVQYMCQQREWSEATALAYIHFVISGRAGGAKMAPITPLVGAFRC